MISQGTWSFQGSALSAAANLATAYVMLVAVRNEKLGRAEKCWFHVIECDLIGFNMIWFCTRVMECCSRNEDLRTTQTIRQHKKVLRLVSCSWHGEFSKELYEQRGYPMWISEQNMAAHPPVSVFFCRFFHGCYSEWIYNEGTVHKGQFWQLRKEPRTIVTFQEIKTSMCFLSWLNHLERWTWYYSSFVSIVGQYPQSLLEYATNVSWF